MKLNMKGIFKSVIAAGTIIGGAILGVEAKKCFTKALPEDGDPLLDGELEEAEETATETEDPAEAENDEPAEEAED